MFIYVSFFPVFSILHKRPETTGLSKSCRQRRSKVALLMVIMWPQCSAIPECPSQVNLKKKERD